MDNKRYFIFCMGSMFCVFLISLVIFFQKFHEPIAYPINEEMMWDRIHEQGTLLYKQIPIFYVTSFQDDPQIVKIEAQINSEQRFNTSFVKAGIDDTYIAYPEVLHRTEFYLESMESSTITKPIEITDLTVYFDDGYQMHVPIEKCILIPYQEDER